MTRLLFLLVCTVFSAALAMQSADARDHAVSSAGDLEPIAELWPTLAPFQHARFCMQYPSDCQSNSPPVDRIDLHDVRTLTLLRDVNRRINFSIIARQKVYAGHPDVGWTLAPSMGDCNDYAVTKRHELLMKGLPSRHLRLSVVRTAGVWGIGHLVLVVATTKGQIVMDNLTDAIRPWRATGYQWLKIQSSDDPHVWLEVKDRQAVQNRMAAGR